MFDETPCALHCEHLYYYNYLLLTYNGPGNTLAPRISEYGIMIIGVVGSAKNGCDDPTASANFEFSSVLLL